MTHQERRLKIDDLKKRRSEIYQLEASIEKELSILIGGCMHEIAIPPDFYEKLAKDEWHSASGICIGCGYSTGWFCPVSKDHICDYNDPDDSDRYMENCRYCGMPDERK